MSGANFQPLPIAVPDFASSDPTFGRDIADIVRANLTRSGLFAVMAGDSLPQQVGSVSAAPDFAAHYDSLDACFTELCQGFMRTAAEETFEAVPESTIVLFGEAPGVIGRPQCSRVAAQENESRNTLRPPTS